VIIACILGKLLIEVTVDVPDDVLHRSQLVLNDESDERPPPIPPKGFIEDTEESQYYDDVIKYAHDNVMADIEYNKLLCNEHAFSTTAECVLLLLGHLSHEH
jgi:hypothetical protein